MPIEESLLLQLLGGHLTDGPDGLKQLSRPGSSGELTSVPHVRTESEIKKNDSTMYSPLSTLDQIGMRPAFENVQYDSYPLVVDGKSYAEYVMKKRPEEKMSEEKKPESEPNKHLGSSFDEYAKKNVGLKNDSEKPPLAYIPKAALFAEGEAFAFGAKKYDAWNYRNGIAVSRTLSAALRHIQQFLAGQDCDDESGVHHLGCARANLAMALDTLENHPEFDDRFVPKNKSQENK